MLRGTNLTYNMGIGQFTLFESSPSEPEGIFTGKVAFNRHRVHWRISGRRLGQTLADSAWLRGSSIPRYLWSHSLLIRCASTMPCLFAPSAKIPSARVTSSRTSSQGSLSAFGLPVTKRLRESLCDSFMLAEALISTTARKSTRKRVCHRYEQEVVAAFCPFRRSWSLENGDHLRWMRRPLTTCSRNPPQSAKHTKLGLLRPQSDIHQDCCFILGYVFQLID